MSFMDTLRHRLQQPGAGPLRKSQMDLLAWAEKNPQNAHHAGYTRTDPRTGKLEVIQAKNERPARDASPRTVLQKLKKKAEEVGRQHGHNISWHVNRRNTYDWDYGEDMSKKAYLNASGTCTHCHALVTLSTHPEKEWSADYLRLNPQDAAQIRWPEVGGIKQCKAKSHVGTLTSEWKDGSNEDEVAEQYAKEFGCRMTSFPFFNNDQRGIEVANAVGKDLHRIGHKYPLVGSLLTAKTGSGAFKTIAFHKQKYLSGHTTAYWQNGDIKIAAVTDHQLSKPLIKSGWHLCDDIESNSRHELGHQIYRKYLTRGDRQRWGKISGQADPVTGYGKKNTEENFCEMFSIFTHPDYSESWWLNRWEEIELNYQKPHQREKRREWGKMYHNFMQEILNRMS